MIYCVRVTVTVSRTFVGWTQEGPNLSAMLGAVCAATYSALCAGEKKGLSLRVAQFFPSSGMGIRITRDYSGYGA